MIEEAPPFRPEAAPEELVAEFADGEIHRTPDPRVVPVFKRIKLEEGDRKLRRHAEHGLKRYAIAGLSV